MARKSKKVYIASFRLMSSLARPYRFHMGASWMGKPSAPNETRLNVPFPPQSHIGKWRDQVLSRMKESSRRDAGEDFLYIQEVRMYLSQIVNSTYERDIRCVTIR
jgi:hypothetical protein